MIPQLLQISVKPVEYKLEIERARLELDQEFKPDVKFKIEPAKLNVKTQNSRVKLNTYEARKSWGNMTTWDKSKVMAEKGMESIKKTTRDYVDIGNSLTLINEGVTVADIYAKRFLGEQPITYMAFLPEGGADITWIPHQIATTFSKPDVNFDWENMFENMRNMMNYVPGSVRMIILEQPKVEIEYVGGFMYFPPSADPDFEAPLE